MSTKKTAAAKKSAPRTTPVKKPAKTAGKKPATGKKPSEAKMDARAFRFAEEYIFDLNATRAYKASHPDTKSTGSASVGGHNLLRNYKVREYIDARLAEQKEEKIASANEVLMTLTAVMRGDATEQVPIGMGEGVQELTEKRVGQKERIRAAELLGKRHGLFQDRVDITSGGEALPLIYLPEVMSARKAGA